MGHRQLDTCYQGARYEYATTLSLSAIASVVQVPRPEDYGFDHICTLIEIENRIRYPRRSFGVQTKSQSESKIIYGDKDDNGKNMYWEIQWLFGRDLPLLISTVNLDPFCLKLYSTWMIWHAYWMSPRNFNRKVNLLIGQQPTNDAEDRWKSYPNNPETYDACDVYLGPPIIQMTAPIPNLSEVESLYECLSFWVNFDMINLQFCKVGIPFMYTVKEWVTNQLPEISKSTYTFWNKYQEIRENLLQTLAPMISALEQDFIANQDNENKARLQGINEIIENFKSIGRKS